MKEMLWNFCKQFVEENIFTKAWDSICNLLNYCASNLYELSFYVLIILCMYNIILAMFGSKEAKIRVLAVIMIWSIICMVSSLLGIGA